jgi:hypothetical protein
MSCKSPWCMPFQGREDAAPHRRHRGDCNNSSTASTVNPVSFDTPAIGTPLSLSRSARLLSCPRVGGGCRPFRPGFRPAMARRLRKRAQRLSPPARPRSPWCSAMLTAFHVSPVPGMVPDSAVGQAPFSRCQASAQRRIRRYVKGGSAALLRTPRRSARRRANDEVSGNPRPPARKAFSTADQVSPGASSYAPLFGAVTSERVLA